MSKWTELRDKILGIGTKPEDIMVSAQEQSRLMAEAALNAYKSAYDRVIASPPQTDLHHYLPRNLPEDADRVRQGITLCVVSDDAYGGD